MSYLFINKEIGAVFLNLKSESIESEFHEYVKPTHRPILNYYCIEVTGITQNFIYRQETFPSVYRKFLKWLEEIKQSKGLRYATPSRRNVAYNCNTAICSWNNWDLAHFFRLSCEPWPLWP